MGEFCNAAAVLIVWVFVALFVVVVVVVTLFVRVLSRQKIVTTLLGSGNSAQVTTIASKPLLGSPGARLRKRTTGRPITLTVTPRSPLTVCHTRKSDGTV